MVNPIKNDIPAEAIDLGARAVRKKQIEQETARRNQESVAEGASANQRGRASATVKLGYSVFYPLLILTLSFLLMMGLQGLQFVKEKGSLQKLQANQAAAIEESKKVRTQLEAIAQGTAQLAAQGNANAIAIIEQLKKQGINVTVPSAQ